MRQTDETLRKAIHIAAGLLAFALRLLPWQLSAAAAAFGVVHNWLLLDRLFGKRVARGEKGFDAGLILYPLTILVLIILFRHRLEIVGVAWAILAFGDGFATIAGQKIGGGTLPWNRDKSWSGFAAFLAFGFVGAEVLFLWLRSEPVAWPPLVIIVVTVVAAAIGESLPLRIDDNVTVPMTAAAVMWLMVTADHRPLVHADGVSMAWLVANLVFAGAGYAAHSVDVSGMIGGAILGAIVIVFGGWELYAVLLAFFVIGTAATKAGYHAKVGRGLAQEKGGRRGFGHAFSNVGVAAILAVGAASRVESSILWFAAAAALATAAADTTASEVGQLIGRRAFLPLTFRRVETGTEGAISVEGTLAGLMAGAVVACLTSFVVFRAVDLRVAGVITLSAFLGSYLESIAGSWNRKRERPVLNGALNFFNTLVGASVCLALL